MWVGRETQKAMKQKCLSCQIKSDACNTDKLDNLTLHVFPFSRNINFYLHKKCSISKKDVFPEEQSPV